MSRTQSFALGFIAIVAATLAVGWLGKSMIEREPTGDLEFWHAGYFRDDAMNRLFTIAFLPSATEADVHRYAKQLTWTPGHTTIAYFYPDGSRIPAGAITGAASMAEATRALGRESGAGRWRYVSLRDESGELQLVDCEAERGHPLCSY